MAETRDIREAGDNGEAGDIGEVGADVQAVMFSPLHSSWAPHEQVSGQITESAFAPSSHPPQSAESMEASL